MEGYPNVHDKQKNGRPRIQIDNLAECQCKSKRKSQFYNNDLSIEFLEVSETALFRIVTSHKLL